MRLTRDAGEIIKSEKIVKSKRLITVGKRNIRVTQVERKLTEIREIRIHLLMGDHNAITVELRTGRHRSMRRRRQRGVGSGTEVRSGLSARWEGLDPGRAETGGSHLRVGKVRGLSKQIEFVQVVRWMGLAARMTVGRMVASGA